MAARVSQIDEFMTRIGRQRGMSLTTGFDVEFDFPSTSKFPADYYKKSKDIITMLCDEAQLPNVQTATGQLSGRYLGESALQYPHSRMFTDVGLGFLCDADMLPAKFFNHWYSFIFGEGINSVVTIDDYESVKAVPVRKKSRVNRVAYPDDCTCNVYIMKTEPNATASNGRIPMTYVLENAYPYSIDAVPLSYGSSQITRVNVSLYYSRHTIIYGDIKSIPSKSDVLVDDITLGGTVPFQSAGTA